MLAQVERGAAVLDEKVPGWANKVDIDILDLESLYDCVLGQVFSDQNVTSGWGAGMDALFPNYMDTNDHIEYGFERDADAGQSYEELTEAWKNYLISRKGA